MYLLIGCFHIFLQPFKFVQLSSIASFLYLFRKSHFSYHSSNSIHPNILWCFYRRLYNVLASPQAHLVQISSVTNFLYILNPLPRVSLLPPFQEFSGLFIQSYIKFSHLPRPIRSRYLLSLIFPISQILFRKSHFSYNSRNSIHPNIL